MLKYRDDCRKALQDGLPPPPQPPLEKRDGAKMTLLQRLSPSKASYMSEVFTKAKRMVQDIEREIEKHISTAVDILNADMSKGPSPFVGGGGVRRRW